MYKRTQDAMRLREDFLSVASHELRTPLTSLQLQLQSLLASAARGQRAPMSPRDEGKLRRAARSTERLSELVETLVDVSRLASGNLSITREPVDLQVAARAAVDRFSDEAARVSCELILTVRGLNGTPEGPIVGLWDRQRLEQMVGSLLSNALKYGVGKPIEVELSAHEGWAEICVRDHGMGIAGTDLERIFGRFERAVPVRNYGGLGLGLYMTREIAQSHGGSIQARSTPGEGSSFTIRLPLEPRP
jgi:signal transduction histidine kinase